MLHRYAFSNFQSFRHRTEVDLTLTKKVALTNWMTEVPTGERVSKIMAAIGPNGSGKTALLKPLAFLGWFISQSFQIPTESAIPLTPHAAAPNEPSEFECTMDFDGKLWRYELSCTPHRVLHEALYQKRERFGYVFIRDWDEEANLYTVKQKDFGLPDKEARKVRQNVSLISWAAQFGEPLAMRMVSPYVITNITVQGRIPLGDWAVMSAAEHFSVHPNQQQLMKNLVLTWDLGLTNVELKSFPVPNPEDPDKPGQNVWIPFGMHKDRGFEFSLPFAMESSGTQGAFVLLSRLLETLEIGGLAVIDEFENDLHPHMLEPVLDLFANPKTNPHNAQLLFSCHAAEVLNLLHKSQVMLVQKDTHCESSAIRMDAVEGIRSDDNYYAKYMAGAYGAVPQF